MTSPIIPEFPQQDLKDQSVRDVVEYSPEQVNDAWCRRILHQVLEALELQYATHMPHRAITPDTIVFHANGEPQLILDDVDAVPAPDAQLADDLTALARVIHYAITQELAPAGPLGERVDGYSAALVATVDACMDADPARRPSSVDDVRSLLGMVPPTLPELPVPAPRLQPPLTPAPVDPAISSAVVVAPHARMRRGQRWAIAAGAGAIAAALAVVWFGGLHGADSRDPIVTTLPQTANGARPGLPASRTAATKDAPVNPAVIGPSADPIPPAATVSARNPADGTSGETASSSAGSPASGTSSAGTTRSGGADDQPDRVTRIAPDPASAIEKVAATSPPAGPARRVATAPSSAGAGNASYQLQIKPWGMVNVDGVDRGASPPLKRLALTPGRHTVRITHPNYRDSVLEFDNAQTTSNGKIIVDFNREAQ